MLEHHAGPPRDPGAVERDVPPRGLGHGGGVRRGQRVPRRLRHRPDLGPGVRRPRHVRLQRVAALRALPVEHPHPARPAASVKAAKIPLEEVLS